jgi:hypothetical protein
VKHPVETTSRAAGFAKGVVVGGIGLVEVLRKPVPEQRDATPSTPPSSPPSTGTDSTTSTDTEATGGYVVPPPSSEPPAEPPIDVVGEALAKEAAEPEPVLLGGTQGEPHPVTREEEHEGAPLTRAELDEIEDETDEALNADEGDVVPDQGQLLDPAVAKAVRSEAEILQGAADPDKG